MILPSRCRHTPGCGWCFPVELWAEFRKRTTSFSICIGTEALSNTRTQTDFILSDDGKHWKSNRNPPHSLLDVAVHMNSFSRLLPAQDNEVSSPHTSLATKQSEHAQEQGKAFPGAICPTSAMLQMCTCDQHHLSKINFPAPRQWPYNSLQAQSTHFWCESPCSAGNQCIYSPNLNCYKHYH